MSDTKTTPQASRAMSPQEIAELTAKDREDAATRAIEILKPTKVVRRKGERTEIYVRQ